MVAEFTPRFSAVPSLPPQNIDAEESLLGAILMDSQAIGVVADRLRPEAFFISAHAQIYQAALAIHAQGGDVDLMSVTTWLYDRKLLEKVGGQSRLAEILGRTVSSINVDRYAELINDKYARRELILAGNHIVQIGYEGFKSLSTVFGEARERLEALIQSPLATGKDEDELAYNKLCERIRDIELNIGNPGLRLFKLQELAKTCGKTTKQLEAIYFMSLLAEENESLLSWKELCDKYGDEVREWILHGFLPKGVIVALHAKGGVGKTRLIYDMAYSLLNGSSWNGFPTTGRRRAIIVQTDESAGDMIDALRRRGYSEKDENVKYKTRWTFEHIPQLIQDCKEFKPEILVIDSITSVSKHSLFSENDVEYARPLLKLKDIAQELGITIVVIHHSSKAGEARGTSAIFNSVSEVWKLERDVEDKTPDSTRRLLTIEKSRSRRPTTYRLDFEPEEGEWKLLSEVGVDENNPDLPTRDRIVEFLWQKAGIRYETTEIAHEVQGDLGRVRLLCSRLAGDGIISVFRQGGKGRGNASKYFIANCHTPENDQLNDRPPKCNENDRPPRSFFSVDTARVPEKMIGRSFNFTPEDEQESQKKNDRAIILRSNTDGCQENKMIAPQNNKMIGGEGDHFIASQNVTDECDSFSAPGSPATEEPGWTKKLFSAIKEQPNEAIQRRFPDEFVEYKEPIAPFKQGDRVWFDDPDDQVPGDYVVENCSHTHARLQGLSELVNVAWLFLVEAAQSAKPSSELTDEDIEDMAESGHIYPPDEEETPVPLSPVYYSRTNLPKRGDRVEKNTGRKGIVVQVSRSSPKYHIQWEGDTVEVRGHDLPDLQVMDVRRVD